MKLVVGLGNPGRRYAFTRHNIGFRVVERFGQRHGIDLAADEFGSRYGRGRIEGPRGEDLDVGILEPQTFMNRSGEAVARALRLLPVVDPAEDLVVVVDDVDLPFGRLRIRPAGSSAGHLGLENVIEHLGSQRFPRLRFGVDRPAEGMDTADYVLEVFSAEEERALGAHIESATDALENVLVEGATAAMNRVNAPATGEA